MIYVITILCYCIAFFFLWKNPDNTSYKILFYSISAIPIWLFCRKYTQKKEKVKLTKKERFLNVLQICVFVALGLSTMILMLTKYYKEHPFFVNTLFVLFIISTIILIVLSRYINKNNNTKT